MKMIKTLCKPFLTVLMCGVILLSMCSNFSVSAAEESVYLSDMNWVSWKMVGGSSAVAGSPYSPGVNETFYYHHKISIAGIEYDKGLCFEPSADSPAEVVYNISDLGYKTFSAVVGKDKDAAAAVGEAALAETLIQFYVLVDDVVKADSGALKYGETYNFNVDVTGGSKLTIRVTDGGDGVYCDTSSWGNPRLSKVTETTSDKDIISFSLAAAQPIALTIDGKIGQTFTVAEQFNTISLGICTWNTSKAGYTFDLRKDSLTGEVVYRHAYSDTADNSNPLYVVGNLPAGTYYLEINKLVLGTEVDNTKVSQVGVWASPNDVDAYVGGTAYLDGIAQTYDINFKVKAITANANALGNEYVLNENSPNNENPLTNDIGAIQIAVMAAASAVIALKKKD